MRSLTTLPLPLVLAVLVLSTAVVAQESPSPSAATTSQAPAAVTSQAPAAANPSCLEAFTEAFSPPAPAPDATAETAASDAHDLKVDAAIRACTSLEEWILTSVGFIMLMPGFDPMAPLLERCADPTASLGDTAICASVGPIALPPSATPGAVASETPAASPTPSPTPSQAPTPTPTPTPTASPTAGAEVARVRMPRNLKVKVPGATRIRYFEVSGQIPDEVLAGAQIASGRHCQHSGAFACALQKWRARARVATNPRTGACSIARATTVLDATVWIPRWIASEPVTQAELDWWKKVLRQAAAHEAEHVAIQKRGLAKFRRQIVGKPCASYQAIVQSAYNEINQAQLRFDEQYRDTPWPQLPGMTFFD